MKNICEYLVFCQLNEHVHVIRHNDERIEDISVAIEMSQRVGYDCGHTWFFENALAMSPVEPLLAIVLKSLLIFVFSGRIPRFGMKFAPGFYFFLPTSKNALRHRIRQSEGHKVRGVLLCPMWQITPILLNFSVRVHCTKFGKRSIWRFRRLGRRDARPPHWQDACATTQAPPFLYNLLHIPQKPPIDLR
jgi:hypothetical protein